MKKGMKRRWLKWLLLLEECYFGVVFGMSIASRLRLVRISCLIF